MRGLLRLWSVMVLGLAGCQVPRRTCCAPCPPTRCGVRPIPEPVRVSPPTPPPSPLDLARQHGSGSAAVWSYLRAAYDANGDGSIESGEYPRDRATFERLDATRDGSLRADDFTGPTNMDQLVASMVLERIEGAEPAHEARWARLAGRIDMNGNGRLAPDEFMAALRVAQATPAPGVPELPAGTHPEASLLATLDSDGSSDVSLGELEAWGAKKVAREAAKQAGAAPKPDPAKMRLLEGVKEGEPAPDFTLEPVDGGAPVRLSQFQGQRPVALVFGSYTCPPFRHAARSVREVFEAYASRVQFFFVYIREAHAVDGPAPMPAPDQPLVQEPASLAERRAIARACVEALNFRRLPTLLDGTDNQAAKAYGAPPIRLYLVGVDGRIAYRGGRGPFGFDPAAWKAAIEQALAPAP